MSRTVVVENNCHIDLQPRHGTRWRIKDPFFAQKLAYLRTKLVTYGSGEDEDRTTDLGTLAHELGKEFSGRSAVRDAAKALEDSLMPPPRSVDNAAHFVTGIYAPTKRDKGVSIFFPILKDDWNKFNSKDPDQSYDPATCGKGKKYEIELVCPNPKPPAGQIIWAQFLSDYFAQIP